MRSCINILTTYFPNLNPPYGVYYEQILEQVQLAEKLGCECFMFNEHHFLDYSRLAANPAVFLAAAAARISRIWLGSCTAKLLPDIVNCRAVAKAPVDPRSGDRHRAGCGKVAVIRTELE